MKDLKEGQIYSIDGGYFQAHYDEERACFALWTYAGYAGIAIARTGFEIGPKGQLLDRIFDFETEEQMVMDVQQYTIDDLEEIDEAEFQG